MKVYADDALTPNILLFVNSFIAMGDVGIYGDAESAANDGK